MSANESWKSLRALRGAPRKGRYLHLDCDTFLGGLSVSPFIPLTSKVIGKMQQRSQIFSNPRSHDFLITD